LTATRFYENDPLPDVGHLDWLIVLGGPMGTYDERRYAWLVEEKRFIERAIQRGKVVIGICLGSQLIAHVLGARVYPNLVKEIGWFPIELTEAGQRSPLFSFLPKKPVVFHWHGDTFDLPPGAVHIARSEGCRHQAFVVGQHVIGLQFHLESTPESVESIIRNCPGELIEDRYFQNADQMLGRREDFEYINRAMDELLARLMQNWRLSPMPDTRCLQRTLKRALRR
jgi:GMP synthase (glutamine-hydrolysing)